MSKGQTVTGGGVVSAKNALSRRDFLKLSGVGVAGVTLLGPSSCGGEGEGSGKVIFSNIPDMSGSIHARIDKFNKQNKGKFQVAYREIQLESQEYFDRLKTEFQAGGGETDVIGGNLPWTAEFAENGWVVDVSSRFPEGGPSKCIKGQVQSLTYENKSWRVP